MLARPPLDSLPAQASLPKGIAIDPAQCEHFGAAPTHAGALECLMSRVPLVHDEAPYAVAIIRGGARDGRDALRTRVQEAMKASGFSFPGSPALANASSMVLLVPWAYRQEFRAIFSSAAGGAQDSAGLETDFSATTVNAPGVDQATFTAELYRFALAFESPLQQLFRRLRGKPACCTWLFPLGCRVVERRTAAGTEWELQFDDFEFLDRAYDLAESVLAKRKREGSSLRMSDGSYSVTRDDGGGRMTEAPSLTLTSKDNSRSTRVEMGRLVREVVMMLANYSRTAMTPLEAPAT